MATTEMKLTSVKSCYEESPPCQRVGVLAGEITENHFHYEMRDNQGEEEEKRGGKERGEKRNTHRAYIFLL